MTPDETIEQQARREAEERYPSGFYTQPVSREAYAAALISERSKPQPSVEDVMEVVRAWERENFDQADWREYQDLRDRLTKLFTGK